VRFRGFLTPPQGPPACSLRLLLLLRTLYLSITYLWHSILVRLPNCIVDCDCTCVYLSITYLWLFFLVLLPGCTVDCDLFVSIAHLSIVLDPCPRVVLSIVIAQSNCIFYCDCTCVYLSIIYLRYLVLVRLPGCMVDCDCTCFVLIEHTSMVLNSCPPA